MEIQFAVACKDSFQETNQFRFVSWSLSTCAFCSLVFPCILQGIFCLLITEGGVLEKKMTTACCPDWVVVGKEMTYCTIFIVFSSFCLSSLKNTLNQKLFVSFEERNVCVWWELDFCQPYFWYDWQVSCLALMENLTQMAVGFADGSVLVYKGDITRDRWDECFALGNLQSQNNKEGI